MIQKDDRIVEDSKRCTASNIEERVYGEFGSGIGKRMDARYFYG